MNILSQVTLMCLFMKTKHLSWKSKVPFCEVGRNKNNVQHFTAESFISDLFTQSIQFYYLMIGNASYLCA